MDCGVSLEYVLQAVAPACNYGPQDVLRDGMRRLEEQKKVMGHWHHALVYVMLNQVMACA